MRAYEVMRDANLSAEVKAGTIVYPLLRHDYGLASDDSRALGYECVSVTLKRSGGYPSFTIAKRDLKEIHVAPLTPPTDEHVQATCRPGAGRETCRYLAISADGWSCEKHSNLAETIDDRVTAPAPWMPQATTAMA